MLWLGFAVATAWPARAADPSQLALEVAAACERVDVAQLSRLLDIEARRREARAARVDVTCRDELVTLRVELAGDPALPRARDFAAADVAGEVGARVLSLAVIELLDEAVTAPKPLPERVPQAEPEPVVTYQPTPSRPRFVPSVRLMAAGGLQSIELAKPLAGAGISVDYLRLGRFGLRLQIDLALGNRSFELGTARLRLTTLSAQGGYLAVHETFTLRALAGYRFGAARIAGESAAGLDTEVGTVAGAYGGPVLSAGAGLRSGSFVAELAAEAGLVSFPIYGEVDGVREIELDGYWLGLSLNVGALL
jgi:hypothetical protein